MNKSFHLGLTMAGAVSAGAYTGGVLDYLLQTLDAWEKEKGKSHVPKHSVSIDIISGASAGGITGAIAALALHLENRNPITPDKRNDEKYLNSNVFYNAWVNLLQDDMIPVLLNESDIEKNSKAISLLNSEFIEKLAQETIQCVPVCTSAPPPYVSKQMELILTLSNLDGFTYNLGFASEGSSNHVMKQHRDYAFFRFGLDYGGDGRIPLQLHQKDVGLRELVEAAPATGAFPIGLAYRKFVRKKKYILDNEDLVFYQRGITKLEDISEDDPEGDYVTYNVDGGMLNNEPFDLTMKLMAKSSADNETAKNEELKPDEKTFDSSIIMVDPFPSDDSVVGGEESISGKEIKNDGTGLFPEFPYTILEAARKVFASMRGELLFKGDDIVKAFSNKDFSRFMIAPRRRVSKDNGKEEIYNGSVAIACGALGGFGGFFDKSFRKHDFFLGRANCQSFLRKYFRIRLENGKPINSLFAEGYSSESIEFFKFQDPLEIESLKKKGSDPTLAPWYVPIIPDIYKNDSKYNEIPLAFPNYSIDKLDTHREIMMNRFKRVAKTFKNKWWYRVIVNLIFIIWGNKIYHGLRNNIESQFKNWKLIK